MSKKMAAKTVLSVFWNQSNLIVTNLTFHQTIGRVGSRGGGRGGAPSSGNVKFATTNYDIDERNTGPIIDRKFEGHSELA